MGVFDFITALPGYEGKPRAALRLNNRHAGIVAPFAADLAGAQVLDLAAHDGRWSYALAAAGAARVVGVEARADLIARFADFPETPFKARVELRHNDIFTEMEAEAARGIRYDVIAVYGIFYHIMDHFRLLRAVRALGPRLVIVDSEFLTRPGQVIELVRERTDNVLNAVAQVPGQEKALIGVPSFSAIEAMADVLDYDIAWTDWTARPEAARQGLTDYYRTEGRMRRGTCALRPRG